MGGQLKVVIAQVNLIVGDIDKNTDIVLAHAKKAIEQHDADIVAFPELTLTGYPPEDLLLRPSLMKRVNKALQRLINAQLDCALVIGHPSREDDRLYNSLSVIMAGRIAACYHKQYLPNYQVFDERRYFRAGKQPCVVLIKDVPVGFTICEDMWEGDPVAQCRNAGAEMLININASPFHVNKLQQRRALLHTRSTENELPIVYVNLVGGQDELVFDGGSMAVDSNGRTCVLAPSFSEGLFPVSMRVVDQKIDQILNQDISPDRSVEAEIYDALVLGMKDYVNKNGFKGVVLGLSGGIDSGLTLAVAVDALGADRVQAVMMPFEYTSQLSKDTAQQQAAGLGVDYQVIPISGIYDAFIQALASEFEGMPVDVSEQNLQARCRGVILMAISNKKGVMVITTGNKSEIAVGYSTLYGDMAGGFDVLKDVAKTMVYKLANYRNKEYSPVSRDVIPQEIIDRPPSAELAPDQVDQDNLPPYDELDEILERYVEKDQSAAEIVAAGFSAQTVKKVLRLVDLNEYKRRQSPIGVRLTQRGFGRDRRYPITNGWPLGE